MNEFNLKFQGYRIKSGIDSIPDESGIYCVYVCNYDENKDTVDLKKLIYIGESGGVGGRIAKHEDWSEWQRYCDAEQELCFNFAFISEGRKRAEAACIYEHKPPINTEYKDNFPFASTKITTSGKNSMLKAQFTVYRT